MFWILISNAKKTKKKKNTKKDLIKCSYFRYFGPFG